MDSQAYPGADSICPQKKLDMILLDGGLTFEELTIASVGSQTQIILGSQVLAELLGVDANAITQNDFDTFVY
nr:hypothetical protein [Arthrospira sp. SH-MAG29]